MSDPKELVRGSRLTKHFGGITANKAVDFAVVEGDLIGLIGPNGSGKTTLIHMLTGHLEPDEGDIVVRGRRLNGQAAHIYAGMRVRSWPSNTMPPALGRSAPEMQWISVVLPEPFGPISPKRSPGMMSTLTVSSAVKPPKRLVTPAMRRMGWAVIVHLPA